MTEPGVDLRGARILVVDDTVANLNVLRHTLEQADYEVQVATNGETALDLVQRALPDLILLDVVLPGIDGYEVCRRIQEQEPIPVIFLTGMVEREQVLEGLRVGGSDYIVKPYMPEEMLVRVRTQLERVLLARALREERARCRTLADERDGLAAKLRARGEG